MQAVSLEGYIDIPEDRLAKAKANIPNYVDTTRSNQGCLSFDIYPSPDVQNRFLVRARFKDQNAVNDHFKSLSKTEWSKATIGIPRIYEVSYDS